MIQSINSACVVRGAAKPDNLKTMTDYDSLIRMDIET